MSLERQFGFGNKLAAGVAAATLGVIGVGAAEALAHDVAYVHTEDCSDGLGGKPEGSVGFENFGDQQGNVLTLTVNGVPFDTPITKDDFAVSFQADSGELTLFASWPGNEATIYSKKRS